LLLQYNVVRELFEILALKPVCVNGKSIAESSGFVAIQPNDQIHFLCSSCYMPHLFYVLLPTPSAQMIELQNQTTQQAKVEGVGTYLSTGGIS